MNRYTNPVYPEYFADPFVWRSSGEFYAVGTGIEEAEGAVESHREPSVFPLLRSTDLVSWRAVGRALVRPEARLGDTFWAPEIAYESGEYFLYYSVGWSDRAHQLRVARSRDPLGPYIDCAALTDLNACGFAIDPHPFRDEDGRWYLFHARDFLSLSDEAGCAVRAGTALVVYPLLGMTKLGSEGRTVARARFDWQRFAMDRPMYGQRFDWHTLEGPCVRKHAGRYYCLYSGGCWQNETYGVDYVAAEAVLGPYSDAGGELGPRVLRSIPGHVHGPGHCSITLGPDEQNLYLAYHAWDPAAQARRMCIDALHFTPQGPRTSGPSWSARPAPRRVLEHARD